MKRCGLYEEKLSPLLYTKAAPPYADAYARFAQVANTMLGKLS